MSRCRTCICLLCTVALLLAFWLARYTWQLSAPIPFDAELLEAWLGCLPHDEQVVHVALQTLQKVALGSLRSEDIDHLRRGNARYSSMPRVQIVNNSLFVTCPRKAGQAPSNACLGNWGQQLLLPPQHPLLSSSSFSSYGRQEKRLGWQLATLRCLNSPCTWIYPT